MSVWEFYASVDGWIRAHSSDDGALTKAERDDLWQWISDGPSQVRGNNPRKTVH
jgi:hypothetical protein